MKFEPVIEAVGIRESDVGRLIEYRTVVTPETARMAFGRVGERVWVRGWLLAFARRDVPRAMELVVYGEVPDQPEGLSK